VQIKISGQRFGICPKTNFVKLIQYLFFAATLATAMLYAHLVPVMEA
jgi:hypothetical protein